MRMDGMRSKIWAKWQKQSEFENESESMCSMRAISEHSQRKRKDDKSISLHEKQQETEYRWYLSPYISEFKAQK